DVLARIDTHAAFGTAKRQVDGSRLDRHPGRQCHDFGQGDVLVKAYAALAWTARGVVLNPVTFEVGNGAVIKLDGNVDDQRALRALQCLYPFGQLAQIGRHTLDLFKIDTPGPKVVGVQIRRKSMSWVF